MTQPTNNQPHPDDDLFAYLNQLIYREFGHHLNTVEDKIKQQILKHFVPKEEVEKAITEAKISLLDDLADVGEIHHSVYDYRHDELTNNQPNTPKGEGEV